MEDLFTVLGYVLLAALVVAGIVIAIPVAAAVGAVWLLGCCCVQVWNASTEGSERRRRLKAATPPPTEVGTPEHRILALPANGREVFGPEPLLPGRLYRVVLTGTYSFTQKVKRRDSSYVSYSKAEYYQRTIRADGFHLEDGHGNFAEPHEALTVGTKRLREVPHLSDGADRDAHRYSFLIDGNGEKFSIALRSFGTDPLGVLRVDVVLLDPSEQTIAARREEEAYRVAIERIKDELARLRISSEASRNWGDPSFVADVSKSRSASLLRDQERIRQDFIGLHQRNPGLVTYMREHDPALLARLTGPLEAFLAAERREAKAAKATVEPRPKPNKPKVTPEQYRERIVRRLTVATDDEKAVLMSTVRAHDEKTAILREAGFEDEEIAAAIGTKADALNDVLGELADRKGGPHATPPQLA